MSPTSRLSRSITALLLTLFGSLWFLLAPLQFGGWNSYVIVNGNSMEPLYHRDDLVVLREAPSYAKGDVVVYPNPDVGPIIHRIIGQDADRWITKGDHNTWIDDYHPRQSEIRGKAWFSLSGFGKVVRWLRQPLVMGILAFLVALGVLAWVWMKPGHRHAFQHSRLQLAQRESAFLQRIHSWHPRNAFLSLGGKMNLKPYREGIFIILAVLACLALVVMVFAFSRPATRSVTDEINYTQSGKFDYTAQAPAGVYDSPQAQTGEPVFPQLSCQVDLSFKYNFSSDRPAQVSGNYLLDAELRDSNGWMHRVSLLPKTAFSSSAFQAATTLNVCQFRARIEQMQQLTGVEHNLYTLAIIPRVNLDGQLGGQDLKESFSPSLLFQLDPLQMQLLNTDGTDQTNPLSPSQAGMIQATHVEANSMLLLNKPVDVGTARIISALVLFTCLAGIAIPEFLARRNRQATPVRLLQERFASQIITLRQASLLSDGKVVDVAAMDDLARLAERYGTMILSQERGEFHDFLVQDGQVTYRFTLGEDPVTVIPAEARDLERDLRSAIENHELEVYYQPVISMESNRITMVEALVRWQHPVRGTLTPGEFLPLAEKNGMIVPIGHWVFRTACEQLSAWQQESQAQLCLSVNLSPSEATADDLEDFITQTLRETGVNAGCLHLELSSSRTVREEVLFNHLAALRKLGVRISIDDFTDRQSLDTLHDFPADLLKIDARSLERSLDDLTQRVIAGALIRVAHDLQLKVVAEGVETEEQFGLLKSLQVDQAQGYWISRPAPADKISLLLRDGIIREETSQEGGAL
jgi:signal peptidase I